MFRDDLASGLADPEGNSLLEKFGGGGLTEFVAIRTQFLDDVIRNAVDRDGIRQVVLLAAGMDTRAFRLNLPDDVVLFEVDHDALHEEKTERLDRAGAVPAVDRRVVHADLAEDWLAPLRAAGWDASKPTVWVPEALFFFLDESAARTLLEKIRTNSARGSQLGIDVLSESLLRNPGTQLFLRKLEKEGIPWKFGTDVPEQFFHECGWKVTELREPGEAGVGEQRWPYQVQSRDTAGVARNWLILAEPVV